MGLGIERTATSTHDWRDKLTQVTQGDTTLTHLTTTDDLLLLAYAAPTDSEPESGSAYGLTTLFQGRAWHGELGMYSYRARWYLPEAGVFGERDPLSYSSSPGLYQYLRGDPCGRVDPFGLSDQKARNVGGIPVPEVWYAVKAARVVVDGRAYLVSPSGTVEDEETGQYLPDSDPRVRKARQATGWSFSNVGLDGLISSLASQTAFLQNRWTAGIVFSAVNTVIPGVTTKGGTLFGFNFQYWINGRNEPVAAVYGIESITYEDPATAQMHYASGRALANLKGIVFSGGASADIAWYEDPSRPYTPFDNMTDPQIVNSWEGPFCEKAVNTPIPLLGGSGFESIHTSTGKGSYAGISWSLAGVGAGYFKANSFYHRIGGPYNPMTFLGFVTGQIALRDIEAPDNVKTAIAVVDSMIEQLRRLK